MSTDLLYCFQEYLHPPALPSICSCLIDFVKFVSYAKCVCSFLLLLKGTHPYQSLSYTSGDTANDSPAHVSRSGMPVKESPRKESLLSYLTGSFPSLHNLLDGTPQRNAANVKSGSLTRTGIDCINNMPMVLLFNLLLLLCVLYG